MSNKIKLVTKSILLVVGSLTYSCATKLPEHLNDSNLAGINLYDKDGKEVIVNPFGNANVAEDLDSNLDINKKLVSYGINNNGNLVKLTLKSGNDDVNKYVTESVPLNDGQYLVSFKSDFRDLKNQLPDSDGKNSSLEKTLNIDLFEPSHLNYGGIFATLKEHNRKYKLDLGKDHNNNNNSGNLGGPSGHSN